MALDAAVHNLDRVRSTMGVAPGTPDVLWLVEDLNERGAERLLARKEFGSRWELAGSDGVCLRLARFRDGRRVTLILGRQVRTADDLEVLVVGIAGPIEARRPLDETIESGLEQEALVMLPWGFGKWTGSRGRSVEQAYWRYAPHGLRLADTGARTGVLRQPPVFARSIADGRPVLAGSDPFPFPDQLAAIGRHGFVLDGVPADPDWGDLHRAVAELDEQPRRFGRRLGFAEFVRLQWKIQMKKRLGTGRAR